MVYPCRLRILVLAETTLRPTRVRQAREYAGIEAEVAPVAAGLDGMHRFQSTLDPIHRGQDVRAVTDILVQRLRDSSDYTTHARMMMGCGLLKKRHVA